MFYVLTLFLLDFQKVKSQTNIELTLAPTPHQSQEWRRLSPT